MRRITSVSELKAGDQIVRVYPDGSTKFLEYVSPLPSYPSEYSLMINENKDGAPKFYNKKLETEEWYLYEGGNDWWWHLHQMEIEAHEKSIEVLKKRQEQLAVTFNGR